MVTHASTRMHGTASLYIHTGARVSHGAPRCARHSAVLRENGQLKHKGGVLSVPHQHKRPISLGRSPTCRRVSPFFLMNVRDYDKLFKAVIYFCCLCYIHTVDLRIYTSDKHFVRSQFILIVPLCQRLLMIFYRSLHSRFLCLRRRSVTDQAAFNL